MSRINVLDQDTINKIAAGEVVERPASVVKELLENSIDAGATAISVYIEGGGVKLIRITDNGAGFEKDDVRLAFKKNTTSKISTAKDLESIATFGFRGEALSSVAAVSKVELLTKRRGEINGTRYVIEGGTELDHDDVGCPEGTTFLIKDLFFNTPVRRKFLKSSTTEAGYVGEVCERAALSHPDISIKFVNDGKQILSTSGNGSLKEVIYLIYGRACAEQLLTVNFTDGDKKVSGMIAKPLISRGNRNHENIFLNGRYVRNSLVYKAIEEGYRTYLMQNRFPLTVLNIEMPATEYDINVHPSKLEVRFSNASEIYELVYRAVFDTIKQGATILEAKVDEEPAKRPEQQARPEPFEFNRKGIDRSVVMEAVDNILRKPGTSNPGGGVVSGYNSRPYEPQRFEVYTSKDATAEERRAADLYQQRKLDEQKGLNSMFAEAPSDLGSDVKDEQPAKTALSYDIPEEKAFDVLMQPLPESHKTAEASEEMASSQADYLQEDSSQTPAGEDITTEPVVKHEQIEFLTPEARKTHRIIGQLFETYWMIEYDDKLYIIDQHAAHERVLYEKFSKEIRENKISFQLLYPAPIIELNLAEADKLNRIMDKLNALGYEIEHFGGRQYRILAVPELLTPLSKEDLLIEFIDSLSEDLISGTLDTVQNRIATMSCKAAVKGNTKLSYEEARKLIDSLMELENPFHCPHGRPIEISFSKYEIEKKFKRIV